MPRPKVTPYKAPPMNCKTEVRAMSGKCPIPINYVGLPLTYPQLVAWFFDVREWGIKRGEYLTKICIIGWLRSLIPFRDDLIEAEDALELLAPEDPE